ncbi:MAG: nitroreductase family protein [Bacteroidales bacterium]|nr:nitroreductase family protein [Bacteroidales bacterium]
MADNYLEKRMEEVSGGKTRITRNNPSIDSLLKRNRSHRGYDASVKLSREALKDILSAVTLCPSGMNAQTLRYRLVPSEEAPLLHSYLTLGAALPQEHLPHPGEEPQGYIVICSTKEENPVVDIDLGIAAQSILLTAVNKGLNGIVILNFRAVDVQKALGLSLKPLAIIGLGKGLDRIFLLPAHPGDSLSYYRKDGVHFVPKLTVEDLIL